MVDAVEVANDQINEADEERGRQDAWPRKIAVLVSCLAVALALSEVGAKSSQTTYLTQHIAASDIWNQYQAKNLRATVWDAQAGQLASLPNAQDPAVRERIREANEKAARMRDEPAAGDGMKQLQAEAEGRERERMEAFHRYHGYELTSGALEIAIVLASVSVITRTRALGLGAGALGVLACVHGLAVLAHII